jgi:hypothetical protein
MSTQPAPSNGIFRHLVRAYPPGRRRDELLDTMLMSARDAARARPTGREVLDVFRHAPRAWLGRPGRRSVVLVAVVVALFTGFLAASFTGRLIGEADRPLPTAGEMTALAEVVTPGAPMVRSERQERLHINGNSEAQFGFVSYAVEHTTTTRDVQAYATAAATAARLRAAGWQISRAYAGGPDDSTNGQTLFASKDGLILRVQYAYNAAIAGSGGAIDVHVRRAEPSGIPAAAAGLLGLVIGWLFTGWASRRTEHSPGTSAVLAALAFAAAITLLPIAMLTGSHYVDVVSQGFSDADGPFWSWTIFGQELFLFAMPSALALIAAASILALYRPPRGGSPTTAQYEPVLHSPDAVVTRGDSHHRHIGAAVALIMLTIGALFVVSGVGGISVGGPLIVAGVLALVLVLRSRLRPKSPR